jgi:hypothetical protein
MVGSLAQLTVALFVMALMLMSMVSFFGLGGSCCDADRDAGFQ